VTRALGVVRLPHDLYVGRFPSVIRGVAEPVARFDGDLRALVREMWAVLDGLGSGGGLAAPQVGVPLRLFVIELTEPHHPFGLHDRDPARAAGFRPIRACVVNPEVVEVAAETELDRESCYSLDGYRGVLPRPTRMRVTAIDEHGAPAAWDLGPWPARVFAHEIDHLDGVLYADRCVGPLEAVSPQGHEGEG
jgi:peptide deformylase